jgi:hypothetical protein
MPNPGLKPWANLYNRFAVPNRNLRNLRIFTSSQGGYTKRPPNLRSKLQAQPIVGQGARCRERLASLGVTDIVAKMREEGALRL